MFSRYICSISFLPQYSLSTGTRIILPVFVLVTDHVAHVALVPAVLPTIVLRFLGLGFLSLLPSLSWGIAAFGIFPFAADKSNVCSGSGLACFKFNLLQITSEDPGVGHCCMSFRIVVVLAVSLSSARFHKPCTACVGLVRAYFVPCLPYVTGFYGLISCRLYRKYRIGNV